MSTALRSLTAAALPLVLLAACARTTPAPSAAAEAPVAPAVATAAPSGPQLVLSPDNVHIEYQVYGSGEPAVLLVHGWACDANYWMQQLPALTGRYTVVAINLAGHGGSGNNRSDWSIANYARDVAAVAGQLPQRALILVGHSMGATVVLAAAPLLRGRVRGIVAVDALRSVGQPALSAAQIEQRLAPFRADFVGATRRLVVGSLFAPGADRTLAQKVAYDMSLEPPGVAIPSMQALLALDLEPLLAQVKVPVYAINSDLLPTDAARIRRFLPDFTLQVLPHSGHFLMLEDPARFNPLLLQDLAAIAARAH
ncbi:MAG: alpha/beta hydrolase [Gammaproteobacteria bacterium]|nr:alpha/beta hydrolase [Gammaproteobacteria bacterium]MBV9698299.1 alpha/beta hydrolase [Gammaproteobacteria bacterium]